MVQSVNLEIPDLLEQEIQQQISATDPDHTVPMTGQKRSLGAYALAASLFLLAFLFIWSTFFSQEEKSVISTVDSDQPKIEAVRAGNEEIKIYYYQSQNKNRLIVWVQKKSKES